MENKARECKENQEVIDLVLELKQAGFNQCNTANTLNINGYKRHNGKEFRTRDISYILIANGVRSLTRFSKKDNAVVSNLSFTAGDEINKGDFVYFDTDNTDNTVKQEPIKEVETKTITNLKETMKDLIIKEVAFNNVTMLGIQRQDGKVFVAVKKICDELGLNSNKQNQRIKRDEILNEGATVLSIPSSGGNQDTFCLDIDFLPFWLTGISTNHCKEEIRPYLKEFKLKAKDILMNAFLNKQPAPVILSPEEMFLVQAQNMVAMRKDVNQLKEVVQGLVANQESSRDQLKYLEVPTVLPLQKTERAQLNQLVRTYSQANSIPTQDSWNRLYSEFLYTYKINIKECASNRNIDNLDYVEKIAKIPELYSLAYKIFITDIFKV